MVEKVCEEGRRSAGVGAGYAGAGMRGGVQHWVGCVQRGRRGKVLRLRQSNTPPGLSAT